jgi:hypothetical protein
MIIDREPTPAIGATFLGLSSLVAALLGGCGAPDEFSEEDVEEPVAAESAALGTTIGTYTWRVGDGSVDMGSGSNRVCFLTSIHGALDARYATVFAQGGGAQRWYLGGSNVDGNVTVTARCISVASPSDYNAKESYQFLPQFSENFRVIGDANGADISPTDYSCFLTSVGGRFFGAGDEVRVRVRSGKWVIDGKSTGADIDSVQASTVCVKRTRQAEFTWTAPNAAVHLASAPVGSAAPACFLTRVGGNFSGESYVGVSRPTAFSYALTGRQPEGDALTARVRCVD